MKVLQVTKGNGAVSIKKCHRFEYGVESGMSWLKLYDQKDNITAHYINCLAVEIQQDEDKKTYCLRKNDENIISDDFIQCNIYSSREYAQFEH